MKNIIIAAGCCILAAILNGCAESTAGIAAVQDFEPERYLGKWYEAARLPQWFEKDMDYVEALYEDGGNGRIIVTNSGRRNGKLRQAVGVAVLKDAGAVPKKGELRVSFFRPFYSDYRIIGLAPDYSYAVVAGKSMDSLWILSRTPRMKPELLAKIISSLRRMGFETDKMEYPLQKESAE